MCSCGMKLSIDRQGTDYLPICLIDFKMTFNEATGVPRICKCDETTERNSPELVKYVPFMNVRFEFYNGPSWTVDQYILPINQAL